MNIKTESLSEVLSGYQRIKNNYHKYKNYTFKKNFEIHCATLGELGMSNRYITSVTGLTKWQIYYRLKKLGITRKDFRDGKNPIVKSMLESCGEYAEKKVANKLKQIIQEEVHE